MRTFKSVDFVFFLSLIYRRGGNASQMFTPAAWRPHLCSRGHSSAVACVASVGTLPIGIIQQQARFRYGHGCFSRRAFLFPFFPHFDSDHSVATHAQLVLPFLTTLAEDWKRCCGLLSPEFAGMVAGDVPRPVAARKQLQTPLATAALNMLTIWA